MISHKGVGVTPAGVTFRHFGLAVRSADNSVTTFLYINNILHSFIQISGSQTFLHIDTQ